EEFLARHEEIAAVVPQPMPLRGAADDRPPRRPIGQGCVEVDGASTRLRFECARLCLHGRPPVRIRAHRSCAAESLWHVSCALRPAHCSALATRSIPAALVNLIVIGPAKGGWS